MSTLQIEMSFVFLVLCNCKGYKRYLSKSVVCATSAAVRDACDDVTDVGIGVGNMNSSNNSNLHPKVHTQHRHYQQITSRVTRHTKSTNFDML